MKRLLLFFSLFFVGSAHGGLDNPLAYITSDGSKIAEVKAASTAPTATDQALVVVPSPNGNQATAALQTTGNTTAGETHGTVAAGTAATKSDLAGAVFNTSLPTLTTGQQAALQVDASGRLYVNPTSLGTPVDNYNTATGIAVNATSNHDYTVTAGKTLTLNGVIASSSSNLKIEVQTETGVGTGVFTTRFVEFNTASALTLTLPFPAALTVAAGVRVRVIRTNRGLAAQDVYSTICGYEN